MTTEQDDRTIELLRRWHGGERAALDELVRCNLGWLRNHVRTRLGPRLRAHGESTDYVQEAVIDVLTYGPRFEISDNGQFRALLCRIVEHNLRDRNPALAAQDERIVRHLRDLATIIHTPAPAAVTT